MCKLYDEKHLAVMSILRFEFVAGVLSSHAFSAHRRIKGFISIALSVMGTDSPRLANPSLI